MPVKDLRSWIAELENAGEVTTIKGANTTEEIGGIVDIYMRKPGNPAVLFDEIPGHPKGHRVLANILTSHQRCAIALGQDPKSTHRDLTQWWRKYFADKPSVPARPVNGGPILENVMKGGEVDITKIPTPRWHEGDGGPFIGTACLVIMKDPDSGWVNAGCYRIQSHGPNTAGLMMSPGKHCRIIMGKYHDRGEKCPVAVVTGMHPALFMLAGLEVPYGKSELDMAGGILGEGVEVINMPKTGLPVPAHAEIAFEGYIAPDDKIMEGPLGEWTGYYSGEARPEPVIRIETLMHRNNPILVGAIPGVPPNDNTFYFGAYRCGAVWNQLEAAGVPGVQGVGALEAGGSRFWLTVSIKQMYGGHSKQAAMAAASCHAGAFNNRWVVVVDDDIDPTNINDVLWAMCTRVDAREDLEIIRGGWSSALDPMCYEYDGDRRNTRTIIDACIPWSRIKTFPKVARNSKELEAKVREKFGKFMPKNG